MDDSVPGPVEAPILWVKSTQVGALRGSLCSKQQGGLQLVKGQASSPETEDLMSPGR